MTWPKSQLASSAPRSAERLVAALRDGGDREEICRELHERYYPPVHSWYYYECGVKVGEQNFRDVDATQELHDAFRQAKRLYYYKNSDNTWRNVDDSNKRYTPRVGDYLERRGPAGAEHSMMMLRCDGDPSRKEAVVFNGPWPVTLRRVPVDYDEKHNHKRFYVGRVDSGRLTARLSRS